MTGSFDFESASMWTPGTGATTSLSISVLWLVVGPEIAADACVADPAIKASATGPTNVRMRWVWVFMRTSLRALLQPACPNFVNMIRQPDHHLEGSLGFVRAAILVPQEP